MKFREYFLERYSASCYFFAYYYNRKTNKSYPSFFLRKNNVQVYDILNKEYLVINHYQYVKNLDEYYKNYKNKLSIFKALKIAKKYEKEYSTFVEDELNGHVDRFGLKTRVEQPFDESEAIVLSEDDYQLH